MRSIEPLHICLLLAIDPDKLPARVNMELFKELQEINATVFTAPASYDGRKNVFSMYRLQLGPTDSKEVRVPTCIKTKFPFSPLYNFIYLSSLMFLFLTKGPHPLLEVVRPRYTKLR